MANIVFGVGTSHSPLLAMKPDQWSLRANDDRENPSHFFRGKIYSFDQLVAFDDRVRDLQWDGDEDLSEVIDSCRDILQTKIESKVLGDQQLLENMILDSSRVAIAARFYILGHIWKVKGHDDRADYYMRDFESLWDAVLSTIRYDQSQDGQEDGEIGAIQEVRFVQ